MTTFCSQCEHVHPDTRKESEPWKFRCMKAPTAPGYGFVSPDYSPDPPYSRCSEINRAGECEMYEPRRVAPEEANG